MPLKKISTYVLLIFTFLMATSCTTFQNKEKIEAEKKKIELKKKNYQALADKISENALIIGTSGSEIRQTYGEPDDIFRSGSSTGSFEVWTYEKIMEKEEDVTWDAIRLYLNNNKLVSWKF